MYLTKYKKYSSTVTAKKAKNCALRNHLKRNFSMEFSTVSLLAKKFKSPKAQKKLYSKFILPTYARIVSKGCSKSGGDTLAENVEEPPFAIKFKERSGRIVANVVDPEEKSRSVKFSKKELEKGIYVIIGTEQSDQKPNVKFLVEKDSNSKFCDFSENLKTENLQSDDDVSFKSALSHLTIEPVKALTKNISTQCYTEKKKIEIRKKKSETDKIKRDAKKLKKIKNKCNKTEEKNDLRQLELSENKPGGAEPSVNYLLQLKNFKKTGANRTNRISTLSIEKSMINLLEKKEKRYNPEERDRLKNERNMTSVSQVLKGVATALKPLQDQLVEIKSKMSQYKGCPERRRRRMEKTTKNEVEQIVDAIKTADGVKPMVEPVRKPSLIVQEMLPSRWYFDPNLNDGGFKCCHVQDTTDDIGSLYDPSSVVYQNQMCHNYSPHMTTSMGMIKRTQRASNYKF